MKCFSLISLLLSCGSAQAEDVYILSVDKPDLYGEIYHIVLGLGSNPKAYVYLPHISGVSDPEKHHAELEDQLKSAQQASEVAGAALEDSFKNVEKYYRDRHLNLGERFFVQLTTSNKGITETKPVRFICLPLEQIRQDLLRGKRLLIPNELALPLKEAFKKENAAHVLLQRAEDVVRGEEKSKLFAAFIRSSGLQDRIIPYGIPASQWKDDDQVINWLKGQPLPSPKGELRVFEDPHRRLMRHSTEDFLKDVEGGTPRDALAKAQALFFKSGNDIPLEVKKYADQKIIKKLPRGKTGVIIWNRISSYSSERNMTEKTMLDLMQEALRLGQVPIIFGPAIPADWISVRKVMASGKVIDASGHWTEAAFKGGDSSILDQLKLFKYLVDRRKVTRQVGMMGGALDGVAIATGVPTVELTLDEKYEERIGPFSEAIGNVTLAHVERVPARGGVRRVWGLVRQKRSV